MDIGTQLSVILLILFVFLLSFTLYRAKRKPDKIQYIRVIICGFLVLGSVVGILGHILLCLGIICVTGLSCLIFIPFSLEHDRVEVAENLKKMDATEPLHFKDFFSWNFVPKLEKKYGPRKAPLIYLTGVTCLTAVFTSNA